MFSKRASIISAVLLIIVVIFVISVVAYQIRTNPYEEHYFEKIGFKEPQYTYAELIEDFGQPLDIQESSDFTEVRYDDFCVRLFTDNPGSRNNECKSFWFGVPVWKQENRCWFNQKRSIGCI